MQPDCSLRSQRIVAAASSVSVPDAPQRGGNRTAARPSGGSAARRHQPARFRSILFQGADAPTAIGERDAPECFADLNLDQVVDAITTGREEYDLKPFFCAPLTAVEAIDYRHEILKDLEDDDVFGCFTSFAQQMRAMREHLAKAQSRRYQHEKQRWFLDAAASYCAAVTRLAGELALVGLRSRGLLAFRDYLTTYAESDDFGLLVEETRALTTELSEVRYSLNIDGSSVRVTRYDSEADYSAEVEATFAKFKQGRVKDYRIGFPGASELNHVEARVLDLVARLYPEVFTELDEYCERRREYLDGALGVFDREVQFYMAYREYVDRFEPAGLRFCYPVVSDNPKEVRALQAFDLALATKLVHDDTPVICNDWYLKDRERVFVVSGPNQGGKTTFARTFGQLHYLAALGCPVPGREAQLFLFDRLFTQFEREEDLETLSGKLEADLVRVRDILDGATGTSIVIMNESFSSTTLRDALFLGTKVLEEIVALDLLCVYVTFVDELASLDEATVSVVSTVAPDDPAVRTFKVVRRPADGLAYAAAIAERYGLTYERLRERLAA